MEDSAAAAAAEAAESGRLPRPDQSGEAAGGDGVCIPRANGGGGVAGATGILALPPLPCGAGFATVGDQVGGDTGGKARSCSAPVGLGPGVHGASPFTSCSRCALATAFASSTCTGGIGLEPG